MLVLGFHWSGADPCIYILNNKDGKIIVTLYMDDFYMISIHKLLDWFKSKFVKWFCWTSIQPSLELCG
jgi:hypothetical protein